jgi:bacteriocin-like protein
MSKTDDTSSDELTIDELAAVSGGLLNAAMAGAIAGAAKGLGPRDDGVLPTLPCDPVDILCRIFS